MTDPIHLSQANIHGPNRLGPYSFVDLFAGCGGLSLGLFQAGWRGIFGVEKDPFAFASLKANFLASDSYFNFLWPSWLPKEPINLSDLLLLYKTELNELASSLDLLVGGPPCQGFSSAGRRDPHDPRNRLFSLYLEAVEILRPKFILIENVRGITIDFPNKDNQSQGVNYSKQLLSKLSEGYNVWSKMVNSSHFGVPQARTRFFIIAQRKDIAISWEPFEELEAMRISFLRSKGLLDNTTAKSAISDLEVNRNGTVPSRDTPGFFEINYLRPLTHYQKLMHDKFINSPSDTRLARHRPEIIERFKSIIELCHHDGHLNTSLKKIDRERFGLLKQALRVLDPDQPAPTITSMPDDLLHYSEPRTLTVRENARLQSFPDWFVFKGKYTTGGHLRRQEVPRFTQVANAVPPLLAEAFGELITKQANRIDCSHGLGHRSLFLRDFNKSQKVDR